MRKGILSLYQQFILDLRKDWKELARLQALGRLEEYFTKRFANTIYLKSDMSVLPLTNLGKSGEPKIDIALLEGDFSEVDFRHRTYKEKAKISAFVEMKYLRNRHRLGPNASDELTTTLKDLKRQLGIFNKHEHAGYKVELRGKRKDIYGVVFASHLRAQGEDDDKAKFKKRILDCAKEQGFWWHDLKRPYLLPVFTDKKILILRREFYASLYHGIWRLGEPGRPAPLTEGL